MGLAEDVKAFVSLREVAMDYGGCQWDMARSDPARFDWWAPCPFHAEITPSFHVVEPPGGQPRWYCFGCGQGGTVIDFAMRLPPGRDMSTALRWLAQEYRIGADPAARRALERERERRVETERRMAERRAKEAKGRWIGALKIWRAAAASDPMLEAYLAARGVDLGAIGGVPVSLRYAPALRCYGKPEGTARRGAVEVEGPAMVAVIGAGGKFRGVHRTWITPEGRARMPGGAKVPKKTIGLTGGLAGWPVRFAKPAARVVVGEGIETTLAAWGALGGAAAGWSAETPRSLDPLVPGPRGAKWLPPPGTREVLLLGEGSKARGDDLAEAYAQAKARLEALGPRVRVWVPPSGWWGGEDAADLAERGELCLDF